MAHNSAQMESDREHLLSQHTETEPPGQLNGGPSINAALSPQANVSDVRGHGSNLIPHTKTYCDDQGHAKENKEHVVYVERWYILMVFSLLAYAQCCCWNTWGPIEDTAIAVLGWKVNEFALLANWGCITFIISAFFFSWLLHAKGLRAAVLLAGGLLVIGVGVRCIPVPISMMKWTINIGHIFIGLSGPIMMAAVTTISATWFPTNERTTATAISASLPYLGLATSFYIGPQIVGDFTLPNTTVSPTTPDANLSLLYDSGQDDIQRHLKEIRLLMIIEFSVTALIYVAALIYYPAKPVTPPTASAIAEREDMKKGIIAIVKKISFWIPALAYAISSGMYSGWMAQMVAIFNNKVDQTTSGWIGFYTNLAALFGGVATARLADYLTGKMKAIILLLLVAASGALSWAILLANDYIPFNDVSLYASVILFGLFLNSTIPLFFEITVEGAFPIGEETSTILMTWLNNVFALCFLTLPMIPFKDLNFDWLNWVMLGSTVICIPLMLFFKEHYNRLDFDTSHRDERSNIQEPECNDWERDQQTLRDPQRGVNGIIPV